MGCSHSNSSIETQVKVEPLESDSSYSEESLLEQVQYSQGKLIFTFSNPSDPFELGLYNKLEITCGDNNPLTIFSEMIEFEGQSFTLSSENTFSNDSTTFYLVGVNNRPEPNYYYIFRWDGEHITQIGQTEPTTKEIFGDVDGDGNLEIGGFNTYCQGVSVEEFNDPNFCLDHFRIIEVQNSYNETNQMIRDTLTEKREVEKLFNSRQKKE